MVAFKEFPKTSSYYWEYRGGCYQGGEIGVYEKGGPGNLYRFDSIPIEVREDESLYVVASNVSNWIGHILSPLFSFLSKVAFLLAFVSFVLFGYVYY